MDQILRALVENALRGLTADTEREQLRLMVTGLALRLMIYAALPHPFLAPTSPSTLNLARAALEYLEET